MKFTERTFKYVGPPRLTRGDYGVNVSGGHNSPDDPEAIFVFDPDFGDACWISIEAGLASGDWQESNSDPVVNECEHPKEDRCFSEDGLLEWCNKCGDLATDHHMRKFGYVHPQL